MKKQINIDKQIDNHRCPDSYFCTVATTGYDSIEKEHKCYLCWKNFCLENDIEIIYD